MLQVETVDQWKNPQDRDLMKPILVTSPWWGPKIPLLYSPQTPHGSVCFQVRESRTRLCTWADTRRHRWARGGILQPHTSCSCREVVGGTDLMESSRVLMSSPKYCVCSLAASLVCVWMLPEEPLLVPCCIACWINWFETASSSPGPSISPGVFIRFFCLLVFIYLL